MHNVCCTYNQKRLSRFYCYVKLNNEYSYLLVDFAINSLNAKSSFQDKGISSKVKLKLTIISFKCS